MTKTIELINPVNEGVRHGIFKQADGPRAAMVIIHGFGEHSGRYKRMMEHFAAHGICTLAIDLEGHGRTGKQGVVRSYDIFHADVTISLNEAREKWSDLPLFLYGHSMGGGLVLNHGINKAPDVKGYLASAPLIRPPEGKFTSLRRNLAIGLRKIFPAMIVKNEIVGSRVTTIPEEQDMYENDPLNHAKMGLCLGVDILLAGEFVEAHADKWQAPLLLMHARQDQLTSFKASEAFAAQADNCTFMPMDNCEHEMHNDVVKNEIYEAMISFMMERI